MCGKIGSVSAQAFFFFGGSFLRQAIFVWVLFAMLLDTFKLNSFVFEVPFAMLLDAFMLNSFVFEVPFTMLLGTFMLN